MARIINIRAYISILQQLEQIEQELAIRDHENGTLYNRLLPFWNSDPRALDLCESAENAMATIDTTFNWVQWQAEVNQYLSTID